MLIKINPKNPDRKIIRKVAKIIKKGGLVIFPTDTVYGFLANARNEKAVGQIFKIKKRPKTKPLAIFVKDLKMAKKYAFVNEKQEKFLKKNWPGKITVILKSKNNLPKGLAAKNKTTGIRIPDYKLIYLLFEKIDFPLAQTSANISGGEATTKIREVLRQFASKRIKPDLIIDAGNLPKNKPSKIIDLTKEKPLTIRF
ncbi:MAG: L-threonylcarbamoyladenylate synthase [bacterium]|nr:L-threonylcarbamoyladenylate synthase [bacterium]